MIDVISWLHAKALGTTSARFRTLLEGRDYRWRSTPLAKLVNVVVSTDSDLASAMTGTSANLTDGRVIE